MTDSKFDRVRHQLYPNQEKATKSVPELLMECIDTFKERNEEYGDAYKTAGGILCKMFPDGVTLKTESDFIRYSLFSHSFNKLLRYASNFNRGGHEDSAKDLSVYAAMLREMDQEESK
ncbi:MAG: hypothetical protein GY861_24330 [bacterium]|nr:hypothetical protein [bacterium]